MAQISGHRGSSHRGRAWRRGLVAAALGLGALASLSPVAARALASEESFPNGRPGCENTFIDFSDPGVLSQSPYDVKSWHKVVSEEPNGHNNVAITNGALEIKIVKSYQNNYGRWTGAGGTVTWKHTIDTGKVCVRMKAAKGGGLVTAFMVDSFLPGQEIDDELDMEIVGGDLYHWQSNYFPQNYGDYCTSGIHEAPGDTHAEYHDFCIERCDDFMSWSVDGKVHRTIYKEDLCDQLWPGRDAKVVLATLWDGGTGEPGTALWATGPTDWSQDTKQPDYKVSVDSFSVRCGCENAVKPVRNGYQDMGCGFKPDTIDPFTNQPIKAQFPTVPKPPAGCWYPWWHPYNGTFNSWNPPGKALAPEPTTAATTAAAAATTATGVKGASTASVQPVSTALPSSPAAAATTAASNAAATTTASSAAPTGNSSAIALSSKPSGSVRAVQPWMAVAFSALLGAIAML